MSARTAAAAAAFAATLMALQGCATPRAEDSVGRYIDDAAITTAVKARYIDSEVVDAAAIEVDTVKGEVVLSGLAKNAQERAAAEAIAREVKGVTEVKNELTVRPAQ